MWRGLGTSMVAALGAGLLVAGLAAACSGEDSAGGGGLGASHAGAAGGVGGNVGGSSAGGGVGGEAAGGAGGTAPPDCTPPVLAPDAIDVTQAPYGATPDDASDDTAAIRAAIAAVPAGGTVYVPDGTFMLSLAEGTALLLKSDMTLYLSAGAVLQATPCDLENYALVQIYDASNVTVVGGTLVGERADHQGTTGEWGHGLTVGSSDHVAIYGVTSKEMWGDGFYLGRGSGAESSDVTVCGCVADHNRRQGLSAVAVLGADIAHSTFANTEGTDPQAGIDLEPNDGDTVDGVHITDCHFDHNQDGVVFTRGTSHSSLDQSTVTNSVHWGVRMSTGTANSVTGSTIQHNGSGGIYMKWAGQSASGNTVADNGGTGIYTEAAVDWDNGDVQQNQITDNVVTGNAGDGIGIDYSHENVVSGNTCQNNGEHGIYLSSADRNTLSDNTLTANSQATDAAFDHVYLDYANDNVIHHNTARMGQLANRPGWGVHIRPAASTGNQVTDNDLVGSGVTGSFFDEGTGTVSSGNQL
jgi:parallel beta-helix repeat protein